MRRVFSRGLNIHGQCGLGRKIEFEIDQFREIEILRKFQVENIFCNYVSNFAVLNGGKEILYWGYNWNNRGFIRYTSLFHLNKYVFRLIKMCFKAFNNFPHSPAILHKFENKIKDISVGACFALFLDEMGNCFSIGDNDYGQLGVTKRQTVYGVELMDCNNNVISKLSSGFQHSLLISTNNKLFGAGRYEKYQLGTEIINEHFLQSKQGETYQYLKQINFPLLAENIIDVAAGKMHSLFLTDKGNVYSIGSNLYGQLGCNNISKDLSKVLVKINFPKDEFIVTLKSGEHHNLFLTKSGLLYGNGNNGLGQIDGDLDALIKCQCVPKQIILPNSSKIIEIFASNNRSGAILENGEAYYWGGLAYDPKYSLLRQPRYSGFNLMNDENGIPKNCKILKVGLGYFHDTVLIEENIHDL